MFVLRFVQILSESLAAFSLRYEQREGLRTKEVTGFLGVGTVLKSTTDGKQA